MKNFIKTKRGKLIIGVCVIIIIVIALILGLSMGGKASNNKPQQTPIITPEKPIKPFKTFTIKKIKWEYGDAGGAHGRCFKLDLSSMKLPNGYTKIMSILKGSTIDFGTFTGGKPKKLKSYGNIPLTDAFEIRIGTKKEKLCICQGIGKGDPNYKILWAYIPDHKIQGGSGTWGDEDFIVNYA